jgi:hypothetical protein
MPNSLGLAEETGIFYGLCLLFPSWVFRLLQGWAYEERTDQKDEERFRRFPAQVDAVQDDGNRLGCQLGKGDLRHIGLNRMQSYIWLVVKL